MYMPTRNFNCANASVGPSTFLKHSAISVVFSELQLNVVANSCPSAFAFSEIDQKQNVHPLSEIPP